MSIEEAEEEWQKEVDEWENTSRIRKRKGMIFFRVTWSRVSGRCRKRKDKKSIVLKNMKKNLNRNRDFRRVTNDVGKGKRFWLSSVQDGEGIEHHNKEEI